MAKSGQTLQRSWTFRLLAACFSMCLIQLMLPCPCTGDDYYVTTSVDRSDCPDIDRPCKTLNEYSTHGVNLTGSEVVMLFLEGLHQLMAHNLRMSHITDVQLKPASPTAGKNAVKIQLLFSNITFESITNLTLENLTINGSTENSSYINSSSNVLVTYQNLDVSGVSLSVTIDSSDSSSFILKDSRIELSSNTGLHVKSRAQSGNITVEKTIISCHQQGGIIVNSIGINLLLEVNIIDTIIERNNISNVVNTADAAGLAVYSTQNSSTYFQFQGVVQIQRSHILNNYNLRAGDRVTVYVSGLLTIDVTDCEFSNNYGTALRAVNIQYNLRLHGNITFYHNSGRRGGALALINTRVYFQELSRVSFVSNFADVGGAIFVELPSLPYDDNNNRYTITKCFYQFAEWENGGRGPNDDYTSVTFTNNSATNGGHHIYGYPLMSYCIVFPISGYFPDVIKRSIDHDIQRLFHFDDQVFSPVSSTPSRVCLLDQPSSNQSFIDDCTNIPLIFKSFDAIPGEEFHLDAVLVGADCGPGTGVVYAQFLPINDGSKATLWPSYQYSQRVHKTNMSQSVSYAVYSNNLYEVLVLTPTDATVSRYGNEQLIEAAIEVYKDTNVLPATLLTTPVYINVTLLDCPPGFYHDSSTMRCECNPQLCSNLHVTESLTNRTGNIYVTSNIWVDAFNKDNVSGVIIHNNCPFDYCTGALLINLDNPNDQCAVNRGLVLCGACVNGSSLVIGSNECLECQNNNGLSLLIFFVAAGPILVFFIKVLNLTVSQATINGLVFYANIIWAYQSIFFSNMVSENKLLYTFIAWINLDFGIETCFVEGLNAFWKTWLQFLFPLYIWCIAGAIILLAHYSECMTKLFGKNSVHVLATLFLLSYAKLLRTIIAVLFPATLYVYDDRGDLVKSQTRVVWALDGTLVYGQSPHIFLLLFIVLIVIPFLWLPYSLILLS